MTDYGPSTYGDRIAEVFDQSFVPDDAHDAVRFLARLAGRGPVLELGIGTGRVAIPLRRRGVEVHGIDASEAMVGRLRAKRGGRDIPVTMGDFGAVRVEGRYPLIFVVFNTFFGLLTQEDQIRCFRNVARRLTPEGVFVIEAFVPDVSRFDRDRQRTETFEVTTEMVRLDVAVHDPIEQRVTSQHVLISEQGIKLYPVQLRYAWPSELDLMAKLGRMRLRDRFGGWHEEPFTSESDRHVSVYELARGRRAR
jgi:SAM-dependent methyltransferase